eukprot:112415-Rhodomonas_salina.3
MNARFRFVGSYHGIAFVTLRPWYPGRNSCSGVLLLPGYPGCPERNPSRCTKFCKIFRIVGT